jgi:hypothetical protein
MGYVAVPRIRATAKTGLEGAQPTAGSGHRMVRCRPAGRPSGRGGELTPIRPGNRCNGRPGRLTFTRPAGPQATGRRAGAGEGPAAVGRRLGRRWATRGGWRRPSSARLTGSQRRRRRPDGNAGHAVAAARQPRRRARPGDGRYGTRSGRADEPGPRPPHQSRVTLFASLPVDSWSLVRLATSADSSGGGVQ